MKYYFSTNCKKYFLYPIFGWLTFSLLPILFVGIISIESILKMISLLLIVFGIFFGFSLLYLFFNHYNKSKNVILKIEKLFHGDFKLIYSKDNNSKEILRNDIKNCEIYQSYPIYEKRSVFRFSYQYEVFYYRIILNDETQINISCAICNTLEKYINSDKLIFKKKWLAIM